VIPRISLRKALADRQLLGGALGGQSWQTWRALLIAAMGETLTDEEREIFRRLTGREREPGQRFLSMRYRRYFFCLRLGLLTMQNCSSFRTTICLRFLLAKRECFKPD
jgi:hypothetical protein